ncbi:uncharacterized protein LOC130216146 [Danio aesculapii]|uniref:uncharacterized protein LOC130216146 n=1 Tax=Danio aesculapii TaxID=1142201 RepID=UPI0024C0AC2C|nr:uncharacterized protein LOC130216146 [Danio aesculapii]
MTHVFNLLSGISILLVLDVTSFHESVVSVSLVEEDSVSLHSGVKKQQRKDTEWYFNNLRIAQLNADLSFNCTDVHCNEGTERFRDRLKLDNQTGSLTIMNIRNTHSGEYKLLIKGNREITFNVTVYGDPAVQHNRLKKNQAESVTLNPGIRRDLIAVLKCLVNDILIAEISVNQSQICADVQCKERFTDRLKLDNETASLTITNIRITDSENYTLEIFIRSDERFSITREKRFSLIVVSPPPSHLSGSTIAGIVVVPVVVAAVAAVVAGVISHLCHRNDEAAPQIVSITHS